MPEKIALVTGSSSGIGLLTALELARAGFTVLPSQTNFLLAKPPGRPAGDWLTLLRDRKILVRWFDRPEVRDYLRITIGSETEVAALLKAVQSILAGKR